MSVASYTNFMPFSHRKAGPTHLNFSGKTVTALILIERFGSPTQTICGRFAPQGASFLRRNLHLFFFRDPNWAQSVVPNFMAPHTDLESKLRCVAPAQESRETCGKLHRKWYTELGGFAIYSPSGSTMPFSATSTANEFLAIAKGAEPFTERASISPMKMQKLVYFAHGWHLAIKDQPLISEPIQAWEYGPVVPSLYQEFKMYGNNEITEFATEPFWDEAKRELFIREPRISDDPARDEAGFAAALIKKVFDKYAGFTAIRLSNATHIKGGPWEQVYRSGSRYVTIPDGLIKDYFKSQRHAA